MEDYGIPFKEFGWICYVVDGTSSEIRIDYKFSSGLTESNSFNLKLERDIKSKLEQLFKWAYSKLTPPNSFKILGKEIQPYYDVEHLLRSIIGPIFGLPNEGVGIYKRVKTKRGERRVERKYLKKEEIEEEFLELFKIIDEYAWEKTSEKIIEEFDIPKDTLPPYINKHVFFAYRCGVEKIAEKLATYLISKNIKVWYFPWKVGWGDSITTEEEKGLKNSFAGLIIFTPDFLEGRTAHEEYRALIAKRKEDPHFKVGILRVNCGREDIPEFMKDYFDVFIKSEDDPDFDNITHIIWRGLLMLPLETPPD